MKLILTARIYATQMDTVWTMNAFVIQILRENIVKTKYNDKERKILVFIQTISFLQ